MSAPDGPGASDAPLLTVLCTTVRFPVPRWRLVAAAHERGLDVATVDRLLRLPPVVDSPEDLRSLLARVPGQQRTVPPAVPPVGAPATAGRPGVTARPAPRRGPR